MLTENFSDASIKVKEHWMNMFLWISNDSERLTGLTFSSYVEISVPIHISQWPSCEAYLITASDVVV
jgi:predicted NAD-dependent protein-ADP-ribosyltransferase YbiA (DUF1768 family)